MFSYVITCLLFIILLLLFDVRKPKHFPKGPKWLPLIGNFLHLRKRVSVLKSHYLVWEELSKTYGNIVGYRLGRNLVVAAFGVDVVHEVLMREEFDGRPDGFFFKFRTFGKRLGLVFSDGSFWQTQRKFTVQHLRNFGFGRKEMELAIEEETQKMIKVLKHSQEKPVQMENCFDISVLNVLWAMMAGKRFELDDGKLIYLLKLIHDGFRIVDMSGGILNQIPVLRFVMPKYCGFSQVKEILDKLYEFLKETIEEHKKTMCKSHCRDFIDAFLQNIVEGDDEFTEEQLYSVCLDFLMAGTETTSNTLSFAFLYMLKYPDVQRKVQNEIDEVLGGNRCPTLQDRINLPYTEAVLMEVQRVANVPPLGIPHRATKDTHLRGYYIPEGTIVLASLFSVHMDSNFWKNPHEFKPERFLNSEGKLQTPEKYFIPFGYGKRRCLGESLAKSNYFLLFTSILYHFTIATDLPEAEIDTEAIDGFTLSPKPYAAVFTSRFV